MRKAIVLAGLCTALLAGCGGNGAREDAPDRGTGDAPALAGPLVYERFAGSTPETSKITLQADGRATLAIEQLALQPDTDGEYKLERVGERRATLAPAELEDVEHALARVDLAKLPAEILPPEPIPDAGGDSVTYQGETVKTGGGAPNVPDDLGELTGTLSVLFDRYAPKRRL